MNVYSTAVDTALLFDLESLKRIRRGYSRPNQKSCIYTANIDTQHEVLQGFPAKVVFAKVSKVSVKRYLAATLDYDWHVDDDVSEDSVRLLVPLSKYGKYQLQIEDRLPIDIKYGYAYVFNAKCMHRLKGIDPGKKDFYMLILDCEK